MKTYRSPRIEVRPDTLEGRWERESFTILIDASVESQEYIEDCEVCRHPIDFIVQLDDRDEPIVQIRQQDEQ